MIDLKALGPHVRERRGEGGRGGRGEGEEIKRIVSYNFNIINIIVEFITRGVY